MNNTRERLKLPAMGLIAVGLVNALIGVLAVLQLLFKLINAEQTTRVFESEARRLGYMFGFFFWPLLMFLGTLISPLVIYGGARMYAAKSYAMARLASRLFPSPLAVSCSAFRSASGRSSSCADPRSKPPSGRRRTACFLKEGKINHVITEFTVELFLLF
ncbi:MAG: hypothetical protein ABR568_21045 [Pyrinomonadaceae bacterium]